MGGLPFKVYIIATHPSADDCARPAVKIVVILFHLERTNFAIRVKIATRIAPKNQRLMVFQPFLAVSRIVLQSRSARRSR